MIEALVAIVILSIGIIALYSLQTMSIKGNAIAISITTAANKGEDKIEEILALPYDTSAITGDPLGDTDSNGCAGLNDRPGATGTGTDQIADHSDATDPHYTIYWNVAKNCTLSAIPNSAVDADEQKPKHIRFFIVRSDLGIQKTIQFNYIKQNSI